VTLLEPGILDGVASATIAKLRRAGVVTLEAAAATPVRELVERTGMGEATALKVNRLARIRVDPGFVPAMEVLERRKSMMRCTTGSSRLDGILGGGVETGAITEFIGEFGSGKTQICMTLSVTAQQPHEQGGLGGRVAVIDTEGTFIPERVVQIADGRGCDSEEALKGLLVASCYNTDHLVILIDSLPRLVEEQGVKLVVVDSMIGHFRGEYIGRENLAARQQKLGSCLHRLQRLAETSNIAVVVTNQVQATPAVNYGDPNRPTGGHVMAHACTHRVYLRKGRGNTRLARVIDSPYLPEVKVRFAVTEKGVEDAEEE